MIMDFFRQGAAQEQPKPARGQGQRGRPGDGVARHEPGGVERAGYAAR